ncbi:MAG: hypothetical protein KF893_04250 [Caldilineaceae bacterium]|nr:hypothetical protein [Caldilineaceae bacterium]
MPNLRQQAQELARRLGDALAEARYWQDRAKTQIADDDRRSREAAAATRQSALDAAARQQQATLTTLTAQRDQELAATLAAYTSAVDALKPPINGLAQSLGYAALPWGDERGWAGWKPPTSLHVPPALRLGQLNVKGQWHTFQPPALLPVIGRGGTVFRAAEVAKSTAAQAMQSLAARLLAALPPGKVRFTFLDPVGLGQNVAAFMHMADDDEALVGGKAWSEPHQIEQQLAGLTEHMENVIQKYLRSQYRSIEEYNAQAGEVAEPYRLLLVFDFPTNFSDTAARRLVSIAQNGPRCGVYPIVMVDASKPLPYGFSLADLEQHATVIAWENGVWRWQDPELRVGELALDPAPPSALLERIVKTVGSGAKAASVVRVPFERIAPRPDQWWAGAENEEGQREGTAEKLRARMGPMGASKVQQLELGGAGTSHHALVVGRIGSGKSTLLHTIITTLALTYSPDEMQLYLIDFKKGVEFQGYARYQLPHARVVAIESEREFGLSVLQGLKAELDRRGRLFTASDAAKANLATYRAKTGETLPRILLLVDEFHVFFSEDDAIATQAGHLLDELVRQGRSFGIHILLASQTLAGSNSLSRSTVDQMAVRIALQCSDADSRLILSDDNPAARLLERPGQAIYNNANGRPEGNNFFQVAYLEDDRRDALLVEIRNFANKRLGSYPPPLVFEGNLPGQISKNARLVALLSAAPAPVRAPTVWLGDPVRISDAVSVTLRKQSGANLLVVGQNEEAATGLLSAALLALAAQTAPADPPAIHLLDFSQGDENSAEFYAQLREHLPQPITVGKRRQMADILDRLATEVGRRLDDEGAPQPPLFLLLHGLQRARDLRQEDSFSSFASFGEEPAPANPSQQFALILRDGPEVGVHTLVWCDTVTNLNRTLDRRLLREFALRVAFQMSAEDSSTLLDSPAASKVGPNRAYLYSEDEGRLEKFRPYGLPALDWLAATAQASPLS